MKTLVFTCLLLLLLGCQGALTFPDSPLESYKTYLHGLCAALGLNCDLSTVSSCWDDTSAAGHLNMVYHGCLEALNSSPKESSSVLTTFFTQGSDRYVKPIEEALNCQESFPYARQIFGRISPPGKGFEGAVKNIIYSASVKPEDCFTIFKNIVTLAEQSNFEAMGMLVGNFITQASALKVKEDSDWRVNAKNSRALLLEGICKGLGIDCPDNSLNSMNEEDSATYLRFLYELINAISRSQQDATKNGIEFFLGRGRELMGKISMSSIEADSHSEEIKMINEKLGMDIWSPEFVESYIGFLSKYPDSCWHYKHAEKQLFEKNDLEGVGIIIGVAWYHFSAWNQGKFGQKMTDTMTDL